MNKKYITPRSSVVALQAETMLALSIQRVDTASDDVVGGDALSNEKAWSSDNWTNEE